MADGFMRLGVIGVAAIAAMVGCSEPRPQARADGLVPVRIGGEMFYLELADDNDEREKGLAWREEIDADGGMIFVFSASAPRSFVMRNCPIPIDIAYVDETKRIVSVYEMQPEEPRRSDEGEGNYEARLKQYPSRFPARYVLEFASGTLARLGVKPGDEVWFEVPSSSG